MKKIAVSIVSLILALITLASCTPAGQGSNESTTAESNNTVETTSGNESTDTEESDTETAEESTDAALEGEHAELITNASKLANGVNAYFESRKHNSFIFENQEMILSYGKDNEKPQLVESLTNKKGGAYIENTMDVFVRMTDGSTYYASSSMANATANIYRLGYYFYEMRLEEQDFIGNFDIEKTKTINHTRPYFYNQVSISKEDGALVVTNDPNSNDSYVEFFKETKYSTETFNYVQVTIKADELVSPGVQVYYIAGDQDGFNDAYTTHFTIKNDGEYHTYMIPLYNLAGYTGDLKGLRFDIGGPEGVYEVKELKLVGVDTGSAPEFLGLNRSFMVYSDKMHHVIQIAATEKTENIAAVGMLTEISESKVAKIVLEDKNGIHETLDGVDWDSVEYIGFDIIDAGIFGYILPYDGKGGRLEVTLENGVYRIEQTLAPEGGVILPSEVNTDNANDFYMGQRIYTDDSHDFSDFLLEAYFERNPLSKKQIKVNTLSSSSASYAGYDSLRGIYKFTLAGSSGFGIAYYGEPNKHYNVDFTITGDDKDRMIYVMTCTSSGSLECAALLDGDGMMLPVPLEVGKNFSEEIGDRNLYNIDDKPYGEVIFPIPVKAESKYEYTVVNIYQNWGKYPLKQISWIQFSTPFYHLSTGVIETNCIIPYYFTKEPGLCSTLPDHRSMSAPFWKDQPQHSSCGTHQFLRYTDADGNYHYSENVQNTIDSYGPTYADVKMDYISTDGKINVSYTHTEMPQTDENRGYYEITYTVNEDIRFKDFARDFQFYSVYSNDPTGKYQRVGYLNSDNKCTTVAANKTTETVEYVLGDQCPYFAFYDMDNYTSEHQQGYANVSFLIYESELIIGGSKSDAPFLLLDMGGTLALSLDLEEVTLKAGDTFKINAIIMPWGSKDLEGVYDTVVNEATGEKYLDKNVRDVRENTLLDPLKITAGANCEAIESVYVPKARTTDGKSAEFTLSGGENNVAVRIYGFDKLTAPKIYEKINGEWVAYDVSSAETPDISGYHHYYDGYCVYYDGDGTYSYSFVVTMDGGNSRTFKVEAVDDFTPWPKEEDVQANNEDKLNIYLDHQEVGVNLGGGLIGEGFISKYEIFGEEFVRLYGMNATSIQEESMMFALSPGADPMVAGRYLVLKYRVPADNADKLGSLQFYVSTQTPNPTEEGLVLYSPVDQDGEWHVIVIDVLKNPRPAFSSVFKPNEDGEYMINFLRFDFFNGKVSPETYFDFAYLGMDDDLDKIIALNKDTEYLTFIEGDVTYKLDTATGEKLNADGSRPDSDSDGGYIGEGSEYKASDKAYWSYLDMINGRGENGAAQIVRNAGNSKNGAAVFNHNGSTVGENLMIFSGWCVVNGGISKYVWSADGGVTWHDAKPNIYVTFPDADSAVIDSARGNLGIALDQGSEKNSMFQGGLNNPDPSTVQGVAADLSDYAGQTVNIIFAAVPETEQDSVCIIACVKGVAVPLNND